AGCAPALLPGHVQTGQGRLPRGAALVTAAVVEAGQHPGDLLEGGHRVGPAGGGDRFPGDQPVHDVLGDAGGHVVEVLPVDHHHRGVVARRIALDALQGDRAVLGGLVVADAEVVREAVEDRIAAHHRTQRIGAHTHGVLPVGVALVLAV